jgi:hypothetical protein
MPFSNTGISGIETITAMPVATSFRIMVPLPHVVLTTIVRLTKNVSNPTPRVFPAI